MRDAGYLGLFPVPPAPPHPGASRGHTEQPAQVTVGQGAFSGPPASRPLAPSPAVRESDAVTHAQRCHLPESGGPRSSFRVLSCSMSRSEEASDLCLSSDPRSV